MSQEPFAEKKRDSLESHAENDEAAKSIPRLHIPRASLCSTTSSKSSSSSRSREFSPPIMTIPMQKISTEFLSESEPESIFETSINQSPFDGNPISRSSVKISPSSRNNPQKYIVRKAAKPSSLHSLSSASSSLSTGGSDQSNYSVNSLLLSVKNLENFNRKSSEAIMQHKKVTSTADENPNVILKSNYYLNNYFLSQESNHFPLYEHRWKMLQNIKSITALNADDDDQERNRATNRINQDKEADQLSTTSSTTTTNFTVISLNDHSDKRLKRSRKAICRRSHTISILIIVMSTIFVIVISIMLLLMDMRNQKMPRR